MNVWLVNPFDNLPSEGNRAQRYWLMAEAFVRAGHAVTYWTGDFSHAKKAKRSVGGCARRSDAIDVIQIPTLPYERNVCLARIRSHRRLARDFERLASALRNARGDALGRPDAVIASLPPLGLCAAAGRVARRFGAAFVADVQDAWPETFERLVPRFALALLGLYAAARRVYRGADGVSAVSARYIELAKASGCEAPMHLAGHCIEMPPPGIRREAPRAKRLAYVGNMSLSYDLATVIGVVRDLPGVTLDIAGSGPDLPRLRALAGSAADGGPIRFHGYLGERALGELLRTCDAGLVPMWPESCVGVPGKLADYAAAGLDVIESLGGECGEIVARHRVGAHYRAGSAESLRAAVAGMPVGRASEEDRRAFARAFDQRQVMDGYVRWVAGLPVFRRPAPGRSH